MTDKKSPEELSDDDLSEAAGGGVFQTPAGGWGKDVYVEHVPSGAKGWTDRNTHDPGYVGETEKNVWKAPAGVTKSKP